MNRWWMGRAMIATAHAGLVAAVYLWLGTVPALLLGSLMLYVVGYDLASRKPAPAAAVATVLLSETMPQADASAPRYPKEWLN